MKRLAHDMSREMNSHSDFTPSPETPRELNERVIKPQPENPANRQIMNKTSDAKIFDLARPMWPADDVITPAISERRIRELECGDEEENLMAAFARHVINPGRNHRNGSKWVSRRSLRNAFPEHFGHLGFFQYSSWKDKEAADFGLPDLFLRSVDLSRARFKPDESVDDLFEDLGRAPDLEALTDEEHQQLRNRIEHNEHRASLTNDQPQSFVASNENGEGLQDEDDLNTTQDGSDIPRPSKRLRSMSSAKPQSGDKSEMHTVPISGWVKPGRLSPVGLSPSGTESRVSPEIKHRTPSHKLDLSTSGRRSPENDNIRVASHSDQQLSKELRTMHEHTPKLSRQEQADITDNEGQSKLPQSSSPAANDMRAVNTILIPKICDILRDFPTAPEDESFPPLLRQLVKATVANTPQIIEDKYLDLLTHVVTHCCSSLPTDQVGTASLVRPVLKVLSRYRHKLADQTHSQIQRDINAAARANDLDWLCTLHADLLLYEAQIEGDQNGR